MADLHELDLDARFNVLTDDVRQSITAPGAGVAMRRAARRRLNQVVGGVAAAVVTVAAGAGALTLADRPSVTPAPPPATTSGRDVTPVKALDAEVLSSATAGWVEAWRVADPPVLTDPPCLRARGLPSPVGDSSVEFASGAEVGAAATYVRFASADEASTAFDAFQRQLDACGVRIHAQTVTAEGRPDARVEIGSVPARAGNPPRTLWIVQADSRVTLVTIAGASAPPSEVGTGVGLAVVNGTWAAIET